jgi:hypothetical protein
MLQAQSPVGATVAVAVAVLLAGMVAIAAGRLVNSVVGLFVLGAGLFCLSMRLGTARDLVFGGGALGLLVAESLLLAGLLLAVCTMMFRVAGPMEDIDPSPDGREPSPWGSHGLIAALAGVLVLPAVWFVAKSPMKGQVLGAVFVGGLLAGLVGRLVRPQVQPVLLFVSPIVFGAVGYVGAAAMTGGPLDTAFIQRTLIPLALPMPIDYAAGSLLGVAVGLGWARSFLHHEGEPEGAAAPTG